MSSWLKTFSPPNRRHDLEYILQINEMWKCVHMHAFLHQTRAVISREKPPLILHLCVVQLHRAREQGIIFVLHILYFNVNALEHHLNKEISSLTLTLQSGTTHLFSRVSHPLISEMVVPVAMVSAQWHVGPAFIWSSGAKTFQMRLPSSFFPPPLLILVELTGSDEGSLRFTMVGALPQKSHDARCDYVWLSRYTVSFTRVRVFISNPLLDRVIAIFLFFPDR